MDPNFTSKIPKKAQPARPGGQSGLPRPTKAVPGTTHARMDARSPNEATGSRIPSPTTTPRLNRSHAEPDRLDNSAKQRPQPRSQHNVDVGPSSPISPLSRSRPTKIPKKFTRNASPTSDDEESDDGGSARTYTITNEPRPHGIVDEPEPAYLSSSSDDRDATGRSGDSAAVFQHFQGQDQDQLSRIPSVEEWLDQNCSTVSVPAATGSGIDEEEVPLFVRSSVENIALPLSALSAPPVSQAQKVDSDEEIEDPGTAETAAVNTAIRSFTSSEPTLVRSPPFELPQNVSSMSLPIPAKSPTTSRVSLSYLADALGVIDSRQLDVSGFGDETDQDDDEPGDDDDDEDSPVEIDADGDDLHEVDGEFEVLEDEIEFGNDGQQLNSHEYDQQEEEIAEADFNQCESDIQHEMDSQSNFYPSQQHLELLHDPFACNEPGSSDDESNASYHDPEDENERHPVQEPVISWSYINSLKLEHGSKSTPQSSSSEDVLLGVPQDAIERELEGLLQAYQAEEEEAPGSGYALQHVPTSGRHNCILNYLAIQPGHLQFSDEVNANGCYEASFSIWNQSERYLVFQICAPESGGNSLAICPEIGGIGPYQRRWVTVQQEFPYMNGWLNEPPVTHVKVQLSAVELIGRQEPHKVVELKEIANFWTKLDTEEFPECEEYEVLNLDIPEDVFQQQAEQVQPGCAPQMGIFGWLQSGDGYAFAQKYRPLFWLLLSLVLVPPFYFGVLESWELYQRNYPRSLFDFNYYIRPGCRGWWDAIYYARCTGLIVSGVAQITYEAVTDFINSILTKIGF